MKFFLSFENLKRRERGQNPVLKKEKTTKTTTTSSKKSGSATVKERRQKNRKKGSKREESNDRTEKRDRMRTRTSPLASFTSTQIGLTPCTHQILLRSLMEWFHPVSIGQLAYQIGISKLIETIHRKKEMKKFIQETKKEKIDRGKRDNLDKSRSVHHLQ